MPRTLGLFPPIAFFACLLLLGGAAAAEPSECLSFDPAKWPSPSRPYFMLAVDTSGSMTACTTPPTNYPSTCNPNAQGYKLNSCGLSPTRYNDAKCALRQTVNAFGGQVNFGLATFAAYISNCNNCNSNCGGGCTPPNTPNCCTSEAYGCTPSCFQAEIATTNSCGGCGPRPGGPETRSGAFVQVPMLQDSFWTSPLVSNVPELLSWFDSSCAQDKELFAAGGTPLNGILRDMKRYFENAWTHPDIPQISYTTPLAAQDLSGSGVNGSTGCRSVNVILLTDGDESCDSQQDAVNAAAALYQTGVTVGGKTFKIRTHVINFAGGNQTNTDQIAAAGGTGASLFATNEVQLAQALANIVAGANEPETCDNQDNNCNGCTDEGFKHYCNTGQTCCSWTTAAQRQQCLDNYKASINNNNPTGNLDLLPCTTNGQQQTPAEWLCFNPGDTCDESDNNCQDGVDENQLKCGNPAACPSAEVCDGIDNDCDGQSDEGGVCGNGCTPSPEICDGCDNDCDGVADNGTFASQPCGLLSPANCVGTRTCQAPQNVPVGTCAPGAGYGQCSNNPQTETCDGIDNDCDGAIDEGYMSSKCVPPSHGANLVYKDVNPMSACVKGDSQCLNGAEVCSGGAGPSVEVCDGIDNDCNGMVDDNVAAGVGQPCGVNSPPCQPGTTACVAGALVCQGGVQPQAEVCDGADNDCDGAVDEIPLADAPMPGMNGCWTLPGNSCSHQNYQWSPPTGATCSGTGTLTAPCNIGTLSCDGANGWTCTNDTAPQAEVCDGIDNNCNGAIDDGNLPNVGGACGSNVGECQEGMLACNLGVLDCVGDIPPSQEICDNKDNDCDGVIDNNIASMGPCDMPYDVNVYPGNRSNSPCQKGVLECDGMGTIVCKNGQGPQPELCDGIDNDCDGNIDETGPAPDGLDLTANPLPPPAGNIGDACGESTGLCEPGVYACLNGIFACVGGTGAIFESCDCEDNDCDGLSDEPPEAGEPPLCSPGKDCVKTSETCQCAAPCAGGEYPCPAGQKCVVADANGTQGSYCVTDFDALCGDCSKKTVKNAQDQVECAPTGTDPAGCLETPVCLCKGQNGCREPCFNVACAAGKVCAKFGPNAGTCVDDSCYLTLCEGCDKDCHDGACINNPCKAGTCPPGEVCKPSTDWSTAICVKSCQDVVCPSGTLCVDGDCKPACDPACPEGQVCDEKANGGPACVPTKCTQPCANGGYCDPLTGICGDDPCAGVVCPEGQACKDGSCGEPQGSNTSSSGSGATSGSGAGGGSSASAGAVGSSAASGGGSKGVFGLPTGGGGVSCAVSHAPGSGSKRSFGWLALAAAAAVWSRRRRVQTEPGANAPSRRWRRRVPGLAGRAKSLATLLVIAAVAGGCEDQPTCFENCDQAVASTAASGGGGSLSIVSSSSSAGGSIFSSSSVGGSDCVITNGGIEICDEIDNNCDGTVDEGIDFNKITHCGTCATNCFTSLLNADPKTIECDWNGMAGEPGSCSFGGCADDYFDLDQDGNSCEYYCVKTANDDSLCNNRDDDCDGDKDEDVNLCNSVDNCGACGRKCSVINGTGKCAPTGNPSTCDASNTQCAIDACDPGWFDLDKSFATGCEYSCTLSNGGVEICGDGIDNDCDGAIDGADSDLSGDAQVGILCYGDPDGLCGTPAHAGLTQCVGQKVICAGMNVLLENQVNETCNGIDDDCDGAVDDNPSDAGGSCGTTNVFPCAFGTKQCVSGKIECVGAINPKTEVCNGIDDDCDGGIDLQNGNPPSDAGASCNVPPMPPMNATSPCKAGTLVCLGGVLGCQGSVGPTAQVDSCGDDSNCDGLLDTQPDTNSDINNCGSCGNDCYAGSLHATWSCKSGVCNFEGCENGWYDFVGNDNQCETPCLPSGGEICDGIDNDCNGMTDDGLTPPSPVQVCGVSPAASRAECTSQVSVTCNNGGWQCNFPAGVCNPSCATPNQEVCDNLDNDCDGLFNENVSNYGLPCASDDGLNPGHGACRRTGTFVCDGGNATKCSATKGSCAQNPGGCAEACDGIDNDCDGDIDEPYTSKGSDSAYFVKPQVTKIGLSLWMMSFEASRPNAHGQSAGTGNGYHCSNCPAGIPNAPSNTPLDETLACSVQGRLPWFNVTPVEAEQSCDAIGGFLCPTTSWTAGCQASNTCEWAYSPRGAACLSKASNNTFCNLGSFDFDPSSSGDQDGLLATGSNQLKNCAADWSGLFQNTTPDIFDQTGNLREITKSGSNIYPLMGGSFSTASEDAATCTFDFYTVEQNFQLLDTGFRCCFDSDPRL